MLSKYILIIFVFVLICGLNENIAFKQEMEGQRIKYVSHFTSVVNGARMAHWREITALKRT